MIIVKRSALAHRGFIFKANDVARHHQEDIELSHNPTLGGWLKGIMR